MNTDREQDNEKFNEMYKKYRTMFKYISLMILKDNYLAEDAVQNCLYHIFKNDVIKRFEDIESEHTKNYLARMISHESRKILIKRRREEEYLTDSQEVHDVPAQYSVEMSVEDAINCREILKIIEEIPSIYANTIKEYAMGNSCYYIAKHSGVPFETVKKRLNRGKKLIKSRMLMSNQAQGF